jgi:hypothetical protein
VSEKAVNRDSAWIDREFGREKWPAIAARIDVELAAGERDLARVVHRVKRWEWQTDRMVRTPVTVDGVCYELPWAFSLHGGLGMQIERLIEAADGADAIVELGSGWGYHLFELWLHGAPRGAVYRALEFTAAGRDCTTKLAALEPHMPLLALPFDYYHADYAALGTFPKKVLVYSVFSIDQIPYLPRAVFETLRGIAPQVIGMHFEPAGWQMGDVRGARSGSSQRYADRHDYNRNLWPLLRELERDGVVEIGETQPELFGMNAENGASMISWSMR